MSHYNIPGGSLPLIAALAMNAPLSGLIPYRNDLCAPQSDHAFTRLSCMKNPSSYKATANDVPERELRKPGIGTPTNLVPQTSELCVDPDK